jgi:hypothetical protein
MTSDFDELASAYLDGEASDADAARIEADPSMQARVNELRAVTEALDANVAPADEFLRRRQIGAALEAFDELAGPGLASGPKGGDPVDPVGPAAPVDLADRRHQRAQDGQPSGRSGMPQWLGVAAVLLLIVGGIGLLTQLGGADDESFETASDSAELDTEDGASDTVADDSTAEAAGAAQAVQPGAGDEAGTEATRAASDSEADTGEDEEGLDEDQAAADDEGTSSESTSAATSTTAVGGLFPDEQIEAARVSFDVPPTQEELLALADGALFDPAVSDCAALLTAETGIAVEFFVPISVAGVDGEALFTGLEPDVSVVAVDEACVFIE